MRLIRPDDYGPSIKKLLVDLPTASLGPGIPNESVRTQLESLTVGQSFFPHNAVNGKMAQACFSSLWMVHHFLVESHEISQAIISPTGIFLHGIMHRREPDFWNSAYWFRKLKTHEIFAPLLKASLDLVRQAGTDSPPFLKNRDTWDPLAFVDACEQCAKGQSPLEPLCLKIQECEWELLFDFSYRHAIGA